MKLLSLLIVALLIGLFALKQLESGAEKKPANTESRQPEGLDVPKAPRTKKELDEFKNQMNDMMQDLEKERSKALDEIDG